MLQEPAQAQAGKCTHNTTGEGSPPQPPTGVGGLRQSSPSSSTAFAAHFKFRCTASVTLLVHRDPPCRGDGKPPFCPPWSGGSPSKFTPGEGSPLQPPTGVGGLLLSSPSSSQANATCGVTVAFNLKFALAGSPVIIEGVTLIQLEAPRKEAWGPSHSVTLMFLSSLRCQSGVTLSL